MVKVFWYLLDMTLAWFPRRAAVRLTAVLRCHPNPSFNCASVNNEVNFFRIGSPETSCFSLVCFSLGGIIEL